MRTQRELKGKRSDMNLRAVEQERELKRQSRNLVENSIPVAQISFSQKITSAEEEGNRNEGNEEAFSSDQAAIAVTEGEEIEPKTVKDAECQTIECDYTVSNKQI